MPASRGYRTISLPGFAALLVLWLGVMLPGSGWAQGVLTLTPGRIATTAAGKGSVGYTGDNGAATSATLATPAAIAYDSGGNLFVAERDNHVVRKLVKSTGVILTVAGTGAAGFSGDGGAATSAQLDTPTGIAVDSSGTLYIADSHNHRIRKVTGNTITTIAGTGTPGFAGDGSIATSSQLSLPQGVAVDASGNIYIADTNNQRVRKITGTTISTLAGTGEQGYSGDGSTAIAALLDSPSSVAVDISGTVYVADRLNQRIRSITSGGIISTVAGGGALSFSGGFDGDGSSATAASLSRPTGVSVDASGTIYIADTDNQRIRTVIGGVIATAAGTGVQDFYGDGGLLNAAALNAPRSVATDASGDLSIADTLNERIRAANDPTIDFDSAQIGFPSTPQTITLTNSGNAPLTISAVTISGPFAATSSSTCSSTSISLAAGASCTEVLAFSPTATDPASGFVTFSGPGIAPQTILLRGAGTIASTSIALTSSAAAPFINQNVIFTAAVQTTGGATPIGGTVMFYSGSTQIGTAQPLSNGTASVTTTFAAAGTYSITAVYSGDANFSGSTSAVLAQLVGDFSFAITSNANGVSIPPGQAAVFHMTAAPLNGPFVFPITLSASGLPPGATVSFDPGTVQLGTSSVPFTMTIQTSAGAATLHRLRDFGGGGTLLALIVMPFLRRKQTVGRRISQLLSVAMVLLSFATLVGITGCGSGSGFFGTPSHTYTIEVTGTAQNAQGATLQHVSNVTLTVQ